MSTYTDASLIVTPNAKKAGKLYALKGADLDVVRATTATYVGSDGLIKTALANKVRFDYSNGSCPSILVEPQRTNLVFPSATATTKTRTVTATAHTLSFYGTGSVVLSGVATGTLVGTGVNNRVTLTFTPTAGSLILTVIGSVTNWQLEAGANATSYIPTTTTAVTRNADVISKRGISSLIGQTEGTVFLNCNLIPTSSPNLNILSITDETTANMARILTSGSNKQIRVLITSNSTTLFSYLYPPNINSLTNIKIAFTYKSNDFVVYINGVQVFVQNSGLVNFTNLLSFINVGSDFGVEQNFINSALIFKTRLSNTELAQLTTL